MDAKEFGTFVQTRRKALGFSQAELAEKLHVTAKAVSRWERGIGFPDIKLLEPLADALDITIVELMQSRKIEEDLTKETAAAMVSETMNTIQEQEKLSWKRKLILFFGTVIILAAEFFLIWVSNVIKEPKWVRFFVHLIGLQGGVWSLRALRAIITRTSMNQEVKKVVITWQMWVSLGISLIGFVMLLWVTLKLPSNTLLHDLLVFTGLMLVLGSGVYYMVKMQDVNEE